MSQTSSQESLRDRKSIHFTLFFFRYSPMLLGARDDITLDYEFEGYILGLAEPSLKELESLRTS